VRHTLIFVLEQRGEKVTVARIRELTRQSQSAIYKQLDKLVDVKIITRTMTKIDRPPGFVNEFSINYGDKATRLIETMGGQAKKARARGKRG
jgi:predicted transcriptional regulator